MVYPVHTSTPPSVPSTGGHIVRYEVDADDRLTSVAEGWIAFAAHNGGSHLTPDRVLKTSLWNHVSGLENRLVYSEIMTYVRAQRRKMKFTFRCDGPRQRREVAMEVQPSSDHGCRFTATLLKEETVPYHGLLDYHSAKSDAVVLICNWCMRVQAAPNLWHEWPDALTHMGLVDLSTWPRPVFTICPDCLGRLGRSIKRRL